MLEETRSPLYVYEKHAYVLERDLFEQGASNKWIKINQSYNNVFNSVQRLSEIFKELQIEVAYGYIEMTHKKYLRSCFLVLDDQVIDTNIHFYKEQKEAKYIVFWKADIHDYVRMVLEGKDERDLTLKNSLLEYEKSWKEYAKRNGIQSIQ